jgi:hypothetical protein
VHHVARRGASDKAKGNAGAVVARRARAAYERFKERKTEMLMLYGSTFVVVHEVLGIASYAITYSLLASGVLDVEHFAGLVGFTEEDGTYPSALLLSSSCSALALNHSPAAQKKGFSLHDRMVTFAMTVALVKAMDIMGLVPLRWAINILITPRVQCACIAWLIIEQ